MKIKKIGLFLLAGLLASMPVTASANVETGSYGWYVHFLPNETMESNFKTGDLQDEARGMQPGDSINLHVSIENKHPETTVWYMKNEVISSLEDATRRAQMTGGGGYTYVLTYTDMGGKTTELFNSDNVGGDDALGEEVGLNEATRSVDDYFHLDRLKQGQTGSVDLQVVLDGETQGNGYQDTLANLALSFAVELDDTVNLEEPGVPRDELPGTPSDVIHPAAVKTGDDTQPIGWIVLMGTAGIVLLILGIRNVRRDRRDRKGGAQ